MSKEANALTKHPDAVAWDEFIERNADLLILRTLGAEKGDPRYLSNRLRRAFEAGMAAARAQAATAANRDTDEATP